MNKQELIDLISNTLGIDPDEIDTESEFIQDFNCEPKDMVELRLILEDKLQTDIDDEKYAEIETVGDLITLVEEYSNELLD